MILNDSGVNLLVEIIVLYITTYHFDEKFLEGKMAIHHRDLK